MNATTIQTVSLDSELFNQIQNFKSIGEYKSNSEILSELIRIGFDYLKEQAEDQYLLALAEERIKNDNGVTHSFEDILAMDGLTLADIEAAEDVEIE